MIQFLIKVHSEECIRVHLVISPPDIPITDPFLRLHNPPQFLCNILDDWILRIADINDYFFGAELVWKLTYRDNLRRIVGAELVRVGRLVIIGFLFTL